MTHLAEMRIYNMPDLFKVARIYKDTNAGFTEFGFGWAHRLVKYFYTEPAEAVNYKAVWYDGHIRRNGVLTVKRNGDFNFVTN